MENLVSVINKLQDVFAMVGAEGLHLPQVVVVGAQSSGKSSVLEGLVGRSFLPRGTGVVTRRPVILQLVQCLHNDPLRDTFQGVPLEGDWAVFLHDKTRSFTDFDKVRAEIEDETNRKAGPNKGICAEPIVLKIFSERVLTLTMIDLPGITKVPVGDQPPDIEHTVKELIIQYVKNPNCIILAIVTANTDMATSESLKIALEVDPDGKRTLAVVTKLDLMDDGTDALEVLCGRVIPVRLGIIGVVNRSQKDIQNNKSIREAIRDEKAFLQRKYPSVASNHGSTYLAKMLHSLLMNHIQNCLPDLRARVSAALSRNQVLIATFGEPIKNLKDALLNVITRFSTAYCDTIQGTHKNLETKELGGGARISYIFHESFSRALASLDPLGGFDRVAIMTAIRNASGARPSLFVPDVCFELLVKIQIKKLEPPSLRCVELVHEELQRIINNCGPEHAMTMARFPHLLERITEVTSQLLIKRVPVTNSVVSNLVQIHSSYINTAHPDFLNETVKMLPLAARSGPVRPQSERSLCRSIMPTAQHTPEPRTDVPQDCIIVEKLITIYFNIIKKMVQDCVPKIIMHFLVNYVMENLLSELVTELYSSADLDYLLEESPVIMEKRKDLTFMLKALEKANNIINEIKDTKAW